MATSEIKIDYKDEVLELPFNVTTACGPVPVRVERLKLKALLDVMYRAINRRDWVPDSRGGEPNHGKYRCKSCGALTDNELQPLSRDESSHYCEKCYIRLSDFDPVAWGDDAIGDYDA